MAISKKTRFEVFKRDGFTCQYCGKTPPDVTLEIDHINPKSNKGKDEINNLITACFDCNRGKGKILLKTVPNTIKENLEILQEKELQLHEYNKFLKKIENRLKKEAQEINELYTSYFEEWALSERFCNISLKRFLNHLPKLEIMDAMNLACSKMIAKYEWDKEKAADNAIKYFCGICWKKIKDDSIKGR